MVFHYQKKNLIIQNGSTLVSSKDNKILKTLISVILTCDTVAVAWGSTRLALCYRYQMLLHEVQHRVNGAEEMRCRTLEAA